MFNLCQARTRLPVFLLESTAPTSDFMVADTLIELINRFLAPTFHAKQYGVSAKFVISGRTFDIARIKPAIVVEAHGDTGTVLQAVIRQYQLSSFTVELSESVLSVDVRS